MQHVWEPGMVAHVGDQSVVPASHHIAGRGETDSECSFFVLETSFPGMGVRNLAPGIGPDALAGTAVRMELGAVPQTGDS